MPVLTFASGPTNSMRGAAFLSGVRDGVVMDIGGTTTDAGVVVNGFPRQASSKVEVNILHLRTKFIYECYLYVYTKGVNFTDAKVVHLFLSNGSEHIWTFPNSETNMHFWVISNHSFLFITISKHSFTGPTNVQILPSQHFPK